MNGQNQVVLEKEMIAIEDAPLPYPAKQQQAILETEWVLVDHGVPKEMVFASQPAQPTAQQEALLRPLAIPLIGTSTQRFIQNVTVVEAFGPLAVIDYELMGEVDPRCVIPLFALQEHNALGRLLINLTHFNPMLGRQEWLVQRLIEDFTAVAEEMSYRVRGFHFDYFFNKMNEIIFTPLTWYGKTAFAHPAQRQFVLAQERRERIRSRILASRPQDPTQRRRDQRQMYIERFRQQYPGAHYTAWESMADEAMYGNNY